ncbi:MAG: hypothetical protein MZU84_05675 [Sphingobacterium sp.]|nr:hypothetical protein [Sphingobacterium sp.]
MSMTMTSASQVGSAREDQPQPALPVAQKEHARQQRPPGRRPGYGSSTGGGTGRAP